MQKRRALPQQLRAAVWREYMGANLDGHCWCCERESINALTNVEYGHVIAHARGGADTVANLRPICSSCNKSMGTRDMLEYKRELMHAFARDSLMDLAAHGQDMVSRAVVQNTSGHNIAIPDSLHSAVCENEDMWIFLLGLTRKSNVFAQICAHNFAIPARLKYARTFGDHTRAKIRAFIHNMPSDVLIFVFANSAQFREMPQFREMSRPELENHIMRAIRAIK
jgi:hypothetical protein